MNTATHKLAWSEYFNNNEEYFNDGVDPFRNWDNLVLPESIAESYLIDGLVVHYANGTREVADKFLSAAIAIVDRALNENKFRSDPCIGGYPLNRGRALRAKVYAHALMTNQLLTADLLRASSDYEEWCKAYEDGHWDSQAEATLIDAIRMALIIGDKEGLRELFDYERQFKWHQKEVELYSQLFQEMNSGLPVRDHKLKAKYQDFYNRVRNPGYQPKMFFESDVARLEIAAIWFRYFVTDNESICWAEVVKAISR